MNRRIRFITLLNRMAKGNAPKRIIAKGNIYEYEPKQSDYICTDIDGKEWYLDYDGVVRLWLNEYVEVLGVDKE